MLVDTLGNSRLVNLQYKRLRAFCHYIKEFLGFSFGKAHIFTIVDIDKILYMNNGCANYYCLIII